MREWIKMIKVIVTKTHLRKKSYLVSRNEIYCSSLINIHVRVQKTRFKDNSTVKICGWFLNGTRVSGLESWSRHRTGRNIPRAGNIWKIWLFCFCWMLMKTTVSPNLLSQLWITQKLSHWRKITKNVLLHRCGGAFAYAEGWVFEPQPRQTNVV